MARTISVEKLARVTAGVSSSDESRPRDVVSLSTCSKLCAIFFVAGIVVGPVLKKGVWKWASKRLRRSKDD